MIQSIDIKNFRCYEGIGVKDLTRVNVIVGRNASGKTALLEAVYLTLGVPALTLKVRGWRGLSGIMPITEQAGSLSAVWRDYFYRFDQGRVVSIAIKGSPEMTRTLTIRCEAESSLNLSRSKVKDETEAGVSPAGRISFDWWKSSRRVGTAKPELQGETITIKGGPDSLPGAFYSSTAPINQQETALWFSELSKRREERPVIEAMQTLYPFVRGLSVETQGATPMVHADITSLPEKIPVGLISSGVNKLVALLCAIATQKHGVLIVDEIENGFHFRAMPEIWRTVYEACRNYHVQLFASTHSQECLESLTDLIKNRDQDFSLLRAVREEEKGGCIVRQFSGEQFLGALEEEVELRS